MIFNRPEYWMREEKTLDEYLAFSSASAFTINADYKTWDGMLEYSVDKTNWEVWDGMFTLFSAELNGKHVLYLRGIGNKNITGWSLTSWKITGESVECRGNIENLLDYETVKSGNHPPMGDLCFFFMFNGCTSLVTAPSLPATTLAPMCYNTMFCGCINLVTVPALPATTLEDSCYQAMFDGCTGIKLSEIKTDEYTQEYRIPTSGHAAAVANALDNMFANTGGTFTGTPEINTTYYISSTNTVV